MPTKNRKFYEFYQELEMIFGTVKDGHLNIVAEKTPLLTQIGDYYLALPFDFIIKEYQSNYRIFTKFNIYIFDYDEKIQTFIRRHFKYPLKRINRINSFDYIQNWSKFRGFKNKHAQFTELIEDVSRFYLKYHPLNYSDISYNEYEYENGDVLRIPYFIKKPKNNNNLEFDNFFLNIKKKFGPIKKIPSLEEVNKKFLDFKSKKKYYKKTLNRLLIGTFLILKNLMNSNVELMLLIKLMLFIKIVSLLSMEVK